MHGQPARRERAGRRQRTGDRGHRATGNHRRTPAAQVAEYLGSPNIVTNDEQHRETWIYDKISTEVAYSKSSGTLGGLIVGGSGGGFGAGSVGSGATQTSQRTLTVIIHFDDASRVRDFAYHTSRF